METGAVLGAAIHTATSGDTATLSSALEEARENVKAVRAATSKRDDESTDDDDDEPKGPNAIVEVVADKGYHKAELLDELKDKGYRTYIAVPAQRGTRRWHDKGGYFTARTFYANRERTSRAKGKSLLRRRGEMLERTFAHACETGGHRRVRLRGRENVEKRYLIQVAAMNLGLVMRSALGSGTPRQAAAARKGRFVAICALWTACAAVVLDLARRLATIALPPWLTAPIRTAAPVSGAALAVSTNATRSPPPWSRYPG